MSVEFYKASDHNGPFGLYRITREDDMLLSEYWAYGDWHTDNSIVAAIEFRGELAYEGPISPEEAESIRQRFEMKDPPRHGPLKAVE